jgi:hypothetical protein
MRDVFKEMTMELRDRSLIESLADQLFDLSGMVDAERDMSS